MLKRIAIIYILTILCIILCCGCGRDNFGKNAAWYNVDSSSEHGEEISAENVVVIDRSSLTDDMSDINQGINGSDENSGKDLDSGMNRDTYSGLNLYNEGDQNSMVTESNSLEKQSLLYCVNARDSRQKLDYMVYTPAEYDKSTPIFVFLHGDGDTAMTFPEELERYEFLRKLQNREWEPDFIFVMPIAKKQGHWAKEVKNVVAILEETVEDVGGSLDNIYISGASAGANGLTVIAQEMEFKGAIYMAGFLAAEFDKVEPDEWLKLWSGKKVYYYRDNLYSHGGYGYRTNEKYLESVQDRFSEYDIDFKMIDLDWNHDIGLVDATLLPCEYRDLNGNVCWDAADELIYGQ